MTDQEHLEELIKWARKDLQQYPQDTYLILLDLFESGCEFAQDTVDDWLNKEDYQRG